MKYHYIYKTTCLLNDKIYVGHHSSNDLNDKYLGSGAYFKRAVKQYGKENFKKEILEVCEYDQLQEREKFWIEKLDSINNGYNKLFTGRGGENLGVPHTDEVKQKMSESRLGEGNPQFGMKAEKSTWWGRKHTEEEKRKIGDAQKGSLNHMFGKHGANNPHTGMKRSKETCENISKALKGKLKGRKLSEETKAKMSAFWQSDKNPNKGRKASEEAKRKMSITRKGVVRKLVTCPYCNQTGGITEFNKTHFKKCNQFQDHERDNSATG